MATGKPIKLNTAPNNIISTLEDLLSRAKKEEISTLFMVGTLKSGEIIHCSVSNNDPFKLIGAIEALKWQTIDHDIEKDYGG